MLRIIRNLSILGTIILTFIFVPYFSGVFLNYLTLLYGSGSVIVVWFAGFVFDLVIYFILHIIISIYSAIDSIFN